MRLDVAVWSLAAVGLSLNPAKCGALFLSGQVPMGVRATRFLVDGRPVRALVDGEASTFLGAEVGFRVVPRMSSMADVAQLGLKVLRSKFAFWQRLDALNPY